MRLLKYWKPIVIATIILYGSIASGDNLNKVSFLNFKFSDKIIHFILYFILSISLMLSFIRNSLIKNRNIKIITFLFVVSYGILMEVFQYYLTSNRSAEVLDIFANTFGCVLGILYTPFLQKFTVSKYL